MTQPDPRTIRTRFSHLKKFAMSARHYIEAISVDGPSETWLRKGSATHALVYGTPRVAVFDGVRNGKKWEAFKAENDGAILVNVKEFEAAEAMARAVRTDPVVVELGLLTTPGSVVETEIEWDFDGRAFRSTPDLFNRRFVVDLKSTRLAKPEFFLRELVKQHYHCQLDTYGKAIEVVHGFRPRDAYIIAVESKSPHVVVVYKLTRKLLDMGSRTVRLWLEELNACESSGHWAGYVSHVVEADVPEWAVDEDDEEESEDEESEAAQ